MDVPLSASFVIFLRWMSALPFQNTHDIKHLLFSYRTAVTPPNLQRDARFYIRSLAEVIKHMVFSIENGRLAKTAWEWYTFFNVALRK